MDYEQWNQAIISYFFEECEPGEIVFLQTNDETLDEIAAQDAGESLITAVRNEVVKVGDRINLWSIDPTKPWISFQGKEPPQVAFLALTVLAASRMESSVSVSQTNYYLRLNELLFDKSNQGIPKGIKRQDFKKLWTHLQRSVSDRYDVELYLTEGSLSRRYVWYPISQCLISKQDRRAVYRFFHLNDLTPFSNLTDSQLEAQLRYWCISSTGPAKIKRYLSNESYKRSILSQVRSLLKHWKGEVPPDAAPAAKSYTTALINVELRFNPFDKVEVRYWFPRRGRNEIDCKINSFGIKHLQTSDSEKWFRPVIDKEGTFWGLLNSLQLQTDEIKPVIYTLDCSDIWVFRRDAERDDGWLSQKNMQLYEDHLIVFRKSLVNQVIAYVEQTCELETLTPIYDDWLCLRGTPTKLLPVSSSELWRLSVDSGKRIRFIGGLSVRDQNSHRAYLNICLPTVFVPDLGPPSEAPLKVGSQELSVGENRLVMLDGIVGPGVHKISYGGKTSYLRVVGPKHSLAHNSRILAATLPQDGSEMPICSMRKIAEISTESGVWLTGARFLGRETPETTWDDVQTVPQVQEEDNNTLFKTPAELISSVIKVAIELKRDKASVPEWLGQAIEYLDRNIALRALVQKKLIYYHEVALSYANLRKEGGSHGSETVSRSKTERLSKKE
ncbi:hypothetical protein F4X33_13380 [Candidatus Poribacteria bacterium]|nr:hypothetical protein [Candidatus Poribacteria bacterium]